MRFSDSAKTLTFLTVLLLSFFTGRSQKNLLKGTVVDTAEKKKLHYSIVALISLADTTQYQSVRSAGNDNFEFSRIVSGNYWLLASSAFVRIPRTNLSAPAPLF